MHKMKSTARREHMVVASSSSSEDDMSLSVDQEEALVAIHDAAYSSAACFTAGSIHPQVRGTLER